MKNDAVHSVMYSQIDHYPQYGVIAWGSTYNNVIDPIFKLQKKIVRVISSPGWFAPSDPIFKSLKILPVHEI